MDQVIDWVQFTKRTNEPKLLWVERQLKGRGIRSRRNGTSFHAPILEVVRHLENEAWAFLTPVDDVPDDDPRWEEEMRNMCSCMAPPPMILDSYPPRCSRCNKPLFVLVSGK